MSQFEVKVVRIADIEAIPNADAIEVAVVGDYRSIIRKGQYLAGDLCVYIPEAAVVPEAVLKQLGLWDDVKKAGKLAGPVGNRVKSIKLRGVLSTGLLYPLKPLKLL